jgi:hypothetical protein
MGRVRRPWKGSMRTERRTETQPHVRAVLPSALFVVSTLMIQLVMQAVSLSQIIMIIIEVIIMEKVYLETAKKNEVELK